MREPACPFHWVLRRMREDGGFGFSSGGGRPRFRGHVSVRLERRSQPDRRRVLVVLLRRSMVIATAGTQRKIAARMLTPPVRSWKSLTLSVMREVPAAICNWRRSSPRRRTQRGSSCVLQPASLAAATHTTRPAATHRRRRLDEQSSTRHTTCLWKGGSPPHRSRRSPRGPKWLDRPSTTPSATRPPSCMP